VAAGAGISLLDGEASHNPVPFFSGLSRATQKEHIENKIKEIKPHIYGGLPQISPFA
jgi:hypothetical protein